jgi:transcriptional regulator with XRE-family HTH domain
MWLTMSARATGNRLGRQVRAARALTGLTQAQVAKAAGIGRKTLSRIETGEVRPIRATLAVLAAVLPLDLQECEQAAETGAVDEELDEVLGGSSGRS